MASLVGYISANGTSFSGPITAGAMAVVRQRVRAELGLDSTVTGAGDYYTKRFDTVTVARALLQNSATNLRSGTGVAQGDGAASSASINDMGAGLVNVSGALQARAIMVAPTQLNLAEFTPRPAASPAPSPAPSPTPMRVLIPTASFGNVPVVGVNATVTRTHEVIIRDLPASGGDGAYNLTFQNNRLADHPGFQISFLAANGTTPTTSVSVAASGQTSFFVKVVADGTLVTADASEFQWFVTATHAGTGQTMRMPFFYRAVLVTISGSPSSTSLVSRTRTCAMKWWRSDGCSERRWSDRISRAIWWKGVREPAVEAGVFAGCAKQGPGVWQRLAASGRAGASLRDIVVIVRIASSVGDPIGQNRLR